MVLRTTPEEYFKSQQGGYGIMNIPNNDSQMLIINWTPISSYSRG